MKQEEHAAMLEWYKTLTALRRRYSVVTSGCLNSVNTKHDEEQGWFSVSYSGRDSDLHIFSNLGPNRIVLDAPAKAKIVVASESCSKLHDSKLELPAESVAVLEAAVS
jgi:maltooligosyltrehalose trehalohydrolase